MEEQLSGTRKALGFIPSATKNKPMHKILLVHPTGGGKTSPFSTQGHVTGAGLLEETPLSPPSREAYTFRALAFYG